MPGHQVAGEGCHTLGLRAHLWPISLLDQPSRSGEWGGDKWPKRLPNIQGGHLSLKLPKEAAFDLGSLSRSG